MKRIKLSDERVKEIRESRIKKIAFLKWVNEGQPNDKDMEIWLEAEKEYEQGMLNFCGYSENSFKELTKLPICPQCKDTKHVTNTIMMKYICAKCNVECSIEHWMGK